MFTSVFVTWALRPPISLTDERNRSVCRYFGKFVFLTVQSNMLNTAYFAAASLSCYTDETALRDWTVRLFPLSFGLGAIITVLYYTLDYPHPAVD